MRQLEELYAEYVAGATLAQVGEKVGMTAGSIDRQFQKANLKNEAETSKHWKNLYDGKVDVYWGKRGRKPSHEKLPLISKTEFEQLGESLRSRILHRVIANARKRHRIELERGLDLGDKAVRKQVKEEMELWDSVHGTEWAFDQLPDG